MEDEILPVAGIRDGMCDEIGALRANEERDKEQLALLSR